MNKRPIFLALLLSLILLPLSVSAAISVEEKDKGSVVISELDNPAVFDFLISNTGQPDSIEIYTLLGVSISPRGTFDVPTGTSTVEVKVYPPASVRRANGPYIFQYQIRGQNSGIYTDTLTIRVVDLKDVLALESVGFKPGANNVRISVRNKENTNLENINLQLKSEFFESTHTISLKPYESVNVNVPIDAEKAQGLSAGRYIIRGTVGLQGAQANVEGILNYVEQEDITSEVESEGFILRSTKTTKTNEGNVPVTDTITVRRDVLTRLFTSYSREPLTADRNGLFVTYEWQNDLQPGESWSLTTTTNYTFPFLLLILVVVIAFSVHRYSRTQVVLKKRVTYVKTKSGQFALKIQLSVKARSNVNSVQVIDRLPGMTQIYEKFGVKPDRIDEASRRLFWNIDRLQAGEERVFSYVVYSTVNIVGRFELPSAMAVYEHNGKVQEAQSNRAFFISETTRVEN